MTFTNETAIEECHEEQDSLPQMSLNLIPLSKLTESAPNDYVGKFFSIKCFYFF